MHYINYGSAKTAPTWLWETLKFSGIKEPPTKLVEDKNKYLTFFKKQTVNFNTNLWQLDSNQITFLNSVATHQSIIFRDPYSYANSLYNFWQSKSDPAGFIYNFKQYFDYSKILKRLPANIMVLYYDDIKSDPQLVLDSLTKYLDLPNVVDINRYINKTIYRQNLLFSNTILGLRVI